MAASHSSQTATQTAWAAVLLRLSCLGAAYSDAVDSLVQTDKS